MAEPQYTSLEGAMRRRDDLGLFEFGFMVNGAFIWFGSRKIGGVVDDIARANGILPPGQVRSEGEPPLELPTPPTPPEPPPPDETYR